MSEVDYLVNGVIYGFGEPAVEDPVSQPKSTKISKSTTSNSESEAKEAYNRSKMSARTESAPDDENNTKQEKTNRDRKSTRLNSSHVSISYAVFCLKTKNKENFDFV